MNTLDMLQSIITDAHRVMEALNDPSTDVRIAAANTIGTADLMAAHDQLRNLCRRMDNEYESNRAFSRCSRMSRHDQIPDGYVCVECEFNPND